MVEGLLGGERTCGGHRADVQIGHAWDVECRVAGVSSDTESDKSKTVVYLFKHAIDITSGSLLVSSCREDHHLSFKSWLKVVRCGEKYKGTHGVRD